MNNPLYPRPTSIRPKLSSPKWQRYVVFDWTTNLHWTGQGWGKECDAAKSFAAFTDAMTAAALDNVSAAGIVC